MNNTYLFLENFSLLLKKGYSLQESLNICYEIQPIDMILDIQNSLVKGDTIESIFMKIQLPSLFKEYFYFFKNKNNFSEAIEGSLNICRVQESYIKRVKKELTYPLVLIIFVLFFSLFVVFVLMPKVFDLFVSFNMSLNVFTRILMYFFYLLPLLFILMIIFLVILIVYLVIALKEKNVKIIDFYYKLPIFQQILKKYFSLKFSVFYNELLNENIDSNTIINQLSENLRNSDMKIVLYEIQRRMNNGELLEAIVEKSDYFDCIFVIFFKMLLEYHNTQALMDYIYITFQKLDNDIKKYMRIITSIVYVFVATFILVVYLSVIIPMMNVISSI